ncbi:phage tail-collar fiber domain-containing protein [Providencia sp. PROV174]|uniref:phage tail-collar fiber domain-containing protein n=1 Tax=Providencia sp. PROV174 TaxID=2949877 RepID=UPI00234A10CB|nr:phage tail protein [Providencia sp. PROV174]
MASVITVAFENWKAQEAASGKAVLLDEFVFANVPNLDPSQPIDRNEKLPPANQIVHRQAVNKAGLASENAVAYSVTLGAEVGNFDFNWIGLLNKASGTVAMITHAPTQKKLKTQNGQQGNVLTRSFILEFQGAAEETQIKTSAETWQIDFTARLSGIDEMQRLINVDSYGAAAFFNDGFEVTRSGEQYTVKKGLGYVGGLRGELAQNQILNGLRNTKVYADFSYQGNIVSQWNTVVKITSAATLNNYVDAAGFTHQVFAIASIDANGNVKDLRPMGALSSQEISALEARFRLDLSKKIDKANITHQMGNSTELVVSQQLLATELGKKQPAGNYAPAGDYATNTALNGGLNEKFDKRSIVQSTGSSTTNAMSQDATTKELNKKLNITGGNIKGGIVVESTSVSILSPNDYGGFTIHRNSGGHVRIETLPAGSTSMLTIANRNSTGGNINVAYVPNKSGHLAMADDVSLSAVPIGGSIIWNTSAPIPANYWANEGRSFSGTEYPEAAKVFTNLKLPDDRGYGIRVADNGRGIDAGRTVGTYQDDAVQNITGNVVISSEVTPSGSANGVFSLTKKSGYAVTSEFFTRPLHEISLDISRQVRTSSETRMKNVSKILITRMK